LVGLGTGTLTSYGRPGDTYRVYELSPAVLNAAERWFTYIADCKALIVMVLGDARLSLEREAPQKFDVLAIDAFSSDSVPAHLLTREALQVYLRHLRPGGIIAFHVSNRYLHLGQVVRQLAHEAGLLSWQIVDKPADTERLTRSDWVWVTANRGLVDELQRQGIGAPLAAKEGLRAWSDDYYNLLQVWK
jgi:spermidine synthase